MYYKTIVGVFSGFGRQVVQATAGFELVHPEFSIDLQYNKIKLSCSPLKLGGHDG
jgi:hypothetical protein